MWTEHTKEPWTLKTRASPVKQALPDTTLPVKSSTLNGRATIRRMWLRVSVTCVLIAGLRAATTQIAVGGTPFIEFYVDF